VEVNQGQKVKAEQGARALDIVALVVDVFCPLGFINFLI